MPVDVSASMPQLDLRDGTVITVTLDDPAATITALVVHGWQTLPLIEPPESAAPLPVFVPVGDEPTLV